MRKKSYTVIDMYLSLTTLYSFDNVTERDDIKDFERNHPEGWVKSEDTRYTYFKCEEHFFIEKESE